MKRVLHQTTPEPEHSLTAAHRLRNSVAFAASPAERSTLPTGLDAVLCAARSRILTHIKIDSLASTLIGYRSVLSREWKTRKKKREKNWKIIGKAGKIYG